MSLPNSQLPSIDTAWFKAQLEHKNLSIRGLAKLLDLHPSGVSLMLRGLRNIRHKEAEKLATILSVSVATIYQRSGKPLASPDTVLRLELADDIVAMTQRLITELESTDAALSRSLNVRNLKRALNDYTTQQQ